MAAADRTSQPLPLSSFNHAVFEVTPLLRSLPSRIFFHPQYDVEDPEDAEPTDALSGVQPWDEVSAINLTCSIGRRSSGHRLLLNVTEMRRKI